MCNNTDSNLKYNDSWCKKTNIMTISNILCLLSMITILSLAIYFYFGIKKDVREYNKYINSICVGDIFEINYILTPENPFERKIESTFTRCVITDIKEDDRGNKWIKYKCLKSNYESSCQLTSFIEDYTRIDNK